MKMNRNVVARVGSLLIALGLVTSCGGAPPPVTTGAPPAAEEFGPGLASHDAAVDAVTLAAKRVLSASFQVTPGDAPGVVTTEWSEHDAKRWPGARTRVVVEITADKVIVRVQCRSERESCARTIPDSIELVALAQAIANDIAGGGPGDRILAVMRGFKDDVCACTDARCIEEVEKAMLEWAMKHMDELKAMKPTRAQDAAADKIEEAMDACKVRIDPATSYTYPSNAPVTPIPPGGTGSPECDGYLATFDKVIVRCKDKLGPAYDAMLQSRNAQVEAFAQWATLDQASLEATLEAAAQGCRSATDAIRQSAQAMGCSL